MHRILLTPLLLLLATLVVSSRAHDAHQQPFGLAKETSIDSILSRHNQVDTATAHLKKFQGGDTLAYVTPWNNRGYDIVKIFKGKFDYLSPVWFYVERRSGQYVLLGEHDVDSSWMEEVRDGPMGRVVPRFQFRGWQIEDFQMLATDPSAGTQLVDLLIHQVLKHGFDGLVLECGYPSFFPRMIEQLAAALHKEAKVLIVVLPPMRTEDYKQWMNADIFAAMAHFVDRFSLMTYDYSMDKTTGGPAAPVDWIMDNIEELTNDDNRHQLLLGLSLYAVAYDGHSPQPMLMKDALKDLPHAKLHWDEGSEEHYAKVEGKTIWMPTRKSIQTRIHIAEDYEVGLSLWEVGQGLDYFYDLF